MACALPPPGGGGKRGRDTKVSLPLLTPQPFLRTRLPSVARLKARGPQRRLVLQGHTLDRSGAFRSGTLPPCTVWPRTVMRGKPRKENSGPNSVPKSARRTEPSPVPPFRCTSPMCQRKGGVGGVKRGQGNHTVPLPPFVSAARRRQCTRHAMANIPRPGRAYLASSGAPLYRRKILRLLSVKQKGHSSPAAASRRNGGTASPLLTVSQAKREPFGSL